MQLRPSSGALFPWKTGFLGKYRSYPERRAVGIAQPRAQFQGWFWSMAGPRTCLGSCAEALQRVRLLVFAQNCTSPVGGLLLDAPLGSRGFRCSIPTRSGPARTPGSDTAVVDAALNAALQEWCVNQPGAPSAPIRCQQAERVGPALPKWLKNHDGGMAERFKAPVLKTGVGASSPWVRIPLPPPES